MTEHLPVLMYHGIHAETATNAHGRYDPVYSVHPDAFARQLDWLQANGYQTVLLDELPGDVGESPERRVLITFDDGDKSNIEVALPLLQARLQRAEFFVTSDFVDQPGMLSAHDVQALGDAGMGIQSHGRSHRFLEDLDSDALNRELSESRSRLQSLTGREVSALALPGGRGGERERAAAAELGYRHFLNSEPGANVRWRSGSWLERIAIKRATPIDDFAALVEWRGAKPRLMRVRFEVLALPKRLLGNSAYQRIRGKVLRQ